MNSRIDLAYDSHVHFFGVGIPAVQWQISTSATELKLPKHLETKKLIKGFGWSDKLPLSEFTNLVQKFPEKDFCLSYFDGHSSFLSKGLIEGYDFKGEKHKILKAGVIVGEAERDEILKRVPVDNQEDLKLMALYAQDVFIGNQINRVRHLTAREEHWHCLTDLEKDGLLKIKIELFFSEFMGQTLEDAVQTFKKLSNKKSKLLTPSGIKIFYDGAFGSNTAYTSLEKTTPPRCSKKKLQEKMEYVFKETRTPLAIHTIGDRALEDAIDVYSNMSDERELPALHLEHAPIFSTKTLKILKDKKLNCVFHFQPSHWINDHAWYSKNKKGLNAHEIYPFKFLFKHGYEFHFGSDAPVVECSKESMTIGLQMIEDDRARLEDVS